MLASVNIEIPDEETIRGCVTVRVNPANQLVLQWHKTAADINVVEVARMLRWLADAMELNAFETGPDA